MKYTFKTEILPIMFVIIGWVLGGYFYAHFPNTVVTHWDFNGNPNGYSSRAVGAFLLPAMLTGIYILFLTLPFIDPKRERYESFARVYHIFKNLILGVMIAIFVITGLVNMGVDVKINTTVPLLVGLLFIILGNYMGKLKQNWFMGIRLPWTLSSENVWNKTHRFGGITFMISGALLIISPLLSPTFGFAFMIGGIILVSLGTTVYSYIVYREELKMKKSLGLK